jgi:antitoxin component YwqK of YwqJK toxin-antitoxin module
MTTPVLSSLPDDILISVSQHLNPDEISIFQQSFKTIHTLVKDNSIFLYKTCLHIQPHGFIRKENGNNIHEGEWRDGKRIGTHREYINGKLIEECDWKDGKRHGKLYRKTFTGYHNDIDIGGYCHDIYKNGVKIHSKGYYPNGNESYKTSYNSKGQKEGLCETYYEDGLLEGTYNYIDGKRKGKQIFYMYNENTHTPTPVTFEI